MCYLNDRMKVAKLKSLRRVGRHQAGAQRTHQWANDLALGRLRARLLRQLLGETDNPALQVGLQRAAAEAESLAWLSPVPLLVLPALLEEKAREARRYASRQAALRETTREWHSLAE